jgi:arylesterase/paraoxonase
MDGKLKRYLLGLGAVLLAAALVVVRFLTVSGAFAEIEPQPLAGCTSQPLPGPAADLEIDRATGIAYLSVLDRRSLGENALIVGSIQKLDLNQAGAQPMPATAGDPPGFRPQGLSLWLHTEGPRRLFVVNRPLDADEREQQTVEVFEEQSDGLFHHQKTLSDALFVHASDVAAVGPDQFYLSNDSGARNFVTRTVEVLFQTAWSNVVYYDGAHASVAVSDRSMATGLTASADGLRLYVAEAGARQILIFDRDPDTGSLYWSSLIEVPGAPERLDIAQDGALWVAVQPNTWARMRSLSSTSVAPTMILTMASPVNGFSKPQRIYVNDGSEFSGGTVSAAHRGRVILGSATESRLMICEVAAATG